MTKLWIMSDLHLEFSGIYDFIEQLPQNMDYDIAVLAGDIDIKIVQSNSHALEIFKDNPIIQVAGNHEFYHGCLEDENTFINSTKTHKGFLQNSILIIDDIRFIGCTLWTDFNLNGDQLGAMRLAKYLINDYRFIRNKNEKITPNEILKEFTVSKYFIMAELEKAFYGKTVVVTHHAPSGRSKSKKIDHRSSNPYFCSDLDSFILQYQPDLWIHGHTHFSHDYYIGKTRVVCNPKGYGNENPSFKSDFVIDI